MFNFTKQQLIDADFRLYGANPVITPFDGSPLVADPSLITPDKAHDGAWHIFFHTVFGVYHFVSADGISFSKRALVVRQAMRPDINVINGEYYLYYERTRPLVMNGLSMINAAKWHSEIYLTKSRDLVNWSKPRPAVTYSRGYENSERGASISNPFYLETKGEHRLYYSCGLTFIKDCGFCEPTYISCAQASNPGGVFVPRKEPIISPDKSDPYLNLCSGCLKVYEVLDGYIGIQNGIFERDGKSFSAILLLSSDDGFNFSFEKVLLSPGAKDWMNQFVYASHLVEYNGELRLYFNARNTADILHGRECIGFASARIR